MILVINEWIFHDLLGENGPEAYDATEYFVERLFQSADWIVMPNEQRWKSKAYQLMISATPGLRQISQLFHRLLRDSNRCIILNSGDIPAAPQGKYEWVPPKDVYLVEACEATKADFLVTTDQTLFDRVTEREVVACQMREDFLSNYDPAG